MDIHYLEIVTRDVDRHVALFESAKGLSFGEPVPELGNARTAPSPTGGMIGIRAPMRDTEAPVVRPYFLVEDLAGAVERLEALGAEIALPSMAIEGRGTIAIYILDGIEHGLWQV